MSKRFTEIDLGPAHLTAGRVTLLRAEVPNEPSPFATIRFSVDGKESPLGARLDRDKGILMPDDLPQLTDQQREALARDLCQHLNPRA